MQVCCTVGGRPVCRHISGAMLADALWHNAAGEPQAASQAAEVVMGGSLLERMRQQNAADSTCTPALADR